MKKILVTGANGQVGSELQYLSKNYPDLEFIFTDVAEMDITKTESISAMFAKHQFEYVIHCAAYTAVDKAEENEELAYKINVIGSKNLAQSCTLHHIPLIQLSTDYVYHNSQNTPFKEGDETNPQGVYAKTKLEGDEIALKIHPNTMILRTSWVYSSFGHNFVKTMIKLGNDRDCLNVVFDQIGTPTYARDLAEAILILIDEVEEGELDKSDLSGVFHYSNEGVASWYDFAVAIMELKEIDCDVYPIVSAKYPTPAARPPFSVLDKAKFRDTFGLVIPHWREGLVRCLAAMS